MSLTTLSIKTTFNRITGKVVIEDTTDYVGQGIDVSTAGLSGYLSITYDIGNGDTVLYNNIGGGTPDIDPAVSMTAVCDINIPLTDQGTPIPATYTVTYNVVSGTLPADVTDTFLYTYDLTDTQICIGSQVNCLTSSITSTDDTAYDVDGASITSIVREHTLYPPPTSGQSVLGPLDLQTLVYTPISTTTWTAQVVSTVTYQQTDGLVIVVSYSGSKEFQATCDVNLSKIICCLEGVSNYYETIQCQDTVKAGIYNNTVVVPTMRHLTLFLAAQSAGNYDAMQAEYQKVLAYSKCSENCGCGTNTPQIVQILGGAGSGSITVVDSPSGNLSVTSDVVGDITTYHLNLSSALLTAIAGIRQYTADTTTPAYINVSTTGSNPRNFRVNWVGGSLPTGSVQRLVLAMSKNMSTPTPYYNCDSIEINTYGNAFNSSNTIFVGSAVGASSEVALIQVTGFLNSTTYPSGALLNALCDLNSYTTAVPSFTDNKTFDVEILWYDPSDANGKVILRFYNPTTGNPYTLADLDGIVSASADIVISLTLSTI